MPAQRPPYLPGHFYHLEWIGERRGTLVDRDFVQQLFPSSQSYRDFVADLSAERQLPKKLKTYLNAWER